MNIIDRAIRKVDKRIRRAIAMEEPPPLPPEIDQEDESDEDYIKRKFNNLLEWLANL